jgi:hypothetical protein
MNYALEEEVQDARCSSRGGGVEERESLGGEGGAFLPCTPAAPEPWWETGVGVPSSNQQAGCKKSLGYL